MIQIPGEITKEAQKFFSNGFIATAERLILQSRVVISFKKGDFDTYCVVSGIIRAERSFEAKFSYKKRLENSESGPLASNCDCNLWDSGHHCPHACALYLAFSLEKFFQNINPEISSQFESDSHTPPMPQRGIGVNPDEYGTLIESPGRLNNAGVNGSYQSLYYNLHNNKIVPFNASQRFEGQILLRLNTKEIDHDINSMKSNIMFAYKDKQGKICDKISLFENLYLYNWETGQAYELTLPQKTFIQKLRNNKFTWGPNDFIGQYFLYTKETFPDRKHESDINITIDHKEIAAHEKIHPLIRFKINPVSREAFQDENSAPRAESKNVFLNIEFFDDNQVLCPPPLIISLFSFSGGYLDGFKKKIDAYDFIKTFTHNLEFGGEDYKKILSSCSFKNSFQSNIDQFLCLDESYYLFNEKLYTYDNFFLKLLLVELKKCFQETIFRFSEYNHETLNYRLRLTALDFLGGLANFQKFTAPFGHQIFYEKEKLSTWTSRIKFERRASTTKWFDLEMALGQDDLDIVTNADLATGVSITSKGLVLLSEDQKEFIKLVKKYLKEESFIEDIPTGAEPNKLNETKKYILPFNKARMFEIFELQKFGLNHLLTGEELEICNKLMNLENIPNYPIPKMIEGVLRPYQVTGYNWLKFLYENKLGACLADDMGLGKTLQAITFLQSIYDQIEKVLIICPVTILINWEKEIAKFSNMKAKIYHGGSRNLGGEEKIILTSYGVLKKEFETTLSQYHFDILILDEVQHLKNLRSLGAFAARSIKANFHICLTGTPVENDLSEFYNILDLSVPGLWGDLQILRVISNTQSRSVARKTAAPFILRRTKSQVLTELPPKTENTIVLSFSDEEQKTYNQKLVTIRSRIQNSPSQRKYGEILKGLLELRQACLWQGLQNTQDVHSVKINFLMEQIEEILSEGHQAIIFSQFTTYLDIIQHYFNKKSWRTVRIDGSQGLKKRQEQVDLFQEGKAPLFLISLKAGGVGLNLTAASYVFIMDPWWNPAVESQAIDRAHRIGQKNNITVYRPVIKSSVEEKVLELQVLKKQLFQELLPESDDNAFTGKLTMKDFEFLFEKD